MDVADRFSRLLELYDLADAFCRNERLLTLARSPEQVEFQSWLFGEFVRQGRGQDPTAVAEQPRRDAVARSPVAELVQARVVDPEVVRDLVHDGDPHLAHELAPRRRTSRAADAGRS